MLKTYDIILIPNVFAHFNLIWALKQSFFAYKHKLLIIPYIRITLGIMADKIKVSEDNKYPVLGLHRDEKMIHMYSLGEIRILTPNEYHKLRAAIPKE